MNKNKNKNIEINQYEIISSNNNILLDNNNSDIGNDNDIDNNDNDNNSNNECELPLELDFDTNVPNTHHIQSLGLIDRIHDKISFFLETSGTGIGTGEGTGTGTGIRDIGKAPTNNSRMITVCLLLSTMLGSGILNQPQVFHEAGYFVWLGGVITIECGLITKITTYQLLVEYVLGVNGKITLDVFIVLGYIGAITSYLTVIGGTASSLLLSWGVNYAIGNVYVVTILLTTSCVLPLCLHRYYGHLGNVSYISTSFVVIIILFVVIAGPIYSIPDRDPSDDQSQSQSQSQSHSIGDVVIQDNNGSVVLLSVVGMCRKIGSVVFSITCLPAIFHAYNSMEDKSVEWSSVMVSE